MLLLGSRSKVLSHLFYSLSGPTVVRYEGDACRDELLKEKFSEKEDHVCIEGVNGSACAINLSCSNMYLNQG